MLIACLDFSHTDQQSKFKYQGFLEIARELGHDVESTSYNKQGEGCLKAFEQAMEKAGQLIQDADAFFIPRPYIFNNRVIHHPAHFSSIQNRVKQGARLLVTPWLDWEHVDNWNSFLTPFDMLVTSLKIHHSAFANPKGVPDYSEDIVIKRSPHSFRDSRLFNGVEEVVLTSPLSIWYGGEALPLLCCTDNEMPVEAKTDFLPIPESLPKDHKDEIPSEWSGRELACMAIWSGSNDGAVLASQGPAFSDPYIKANRQLAANVISFLCETSRPPLSPVNLSHHIEICLFDFVLAVVKKDAGENWWIELVPENIRKKSAERHEEDRCRYRKQAHFDLLDLKSIMEKNWTLFEPYFQAEGYKGGKKKSLEWFDDLNGLRRLIAHPLKLHDAGGKISNEDIERLSSWEALAVRLLHAAEA